MKGGSAIYCPACSQRQTVGRPGEKLELPLRIRCVECGAELVVEKSLSGGVHVSMGAASPG